MTDREIENTLRYMAGGSSELNYIAKVFINLIHRVRKLEGEEGKVDSNTRS